MTRLAELVRTIALETWAGEEEEETCRIVVDEKVSADSLSRTENALGITFPSEYVAFVTEVGLCHFESHHEECEPDRLCRMLSPAQIETIVGYFREWTKEHDCYDAEDEARARGQQEIRDILIPFQYHGDGTATDVYCFVPSQVKDGLPLVIIAYHDDDELELWFEPNEGQVWGFGAHLEGWVREMREPD